LTTLIEIRQKAIKELKDDFKCQLEYLETIESCYMMNPEIGVTLSNESEAGEVIEENLDYLIRDNSTLKHNHTTETRLRAIQILKDWNDEIEGVQS